MSIQQRFDLYLSLLVVLLLTPFITSLSSWIDTDTPRDVYTIQVPNGPYDFLKGENSTYHLIFSDEFNTTRKFGSGFDHKWTATDIRDTSNMGKHYFTPQAVQTDEGNLIITTSKPKERYRGAQYVSGAVQTWNKFCFTSGFTEIKAILPGKWGIPGTWPAMWIMGNIGRAAYLESQDGTWPWSFNYCAPWLSQSQIKIQRINACDNYTIKGDPNSKPEQMGLNPHQGRGATEIDIMEGQVRHHGAPGEISTSLQISPGMDGSMRPAIGAKPKPGEWYQNLTFGNYTEINTAYYGDAGLDSISAVTELNPNAYKDYHLYRLDWAAGHNGYLRWWIDGLFLFDIPASALEKWIAGVPPRMIPAEPSYLILSTAVSEKFSPPCAGEICNSIWPANFTIDYVRVYQNPAHDTNSIGCDPKEYPTRTYIYKNPVAYGLPWYITLNMESIASYGLSMLSGCLFLYLCFYSTQNLKLTSFLGVGALGAAFCFDFVQYSMNVLPFPISVIVSIIFGTVVGILSLFVPHRSVQLSGCIIALVYLMELLRISLLSQRILTIFWLLSNMLLVLQPYTSFLFLLIYSSIIASFGFITCLSQFMTSANVASSFIYKISLLSGFSQQSVAFCDLLACYYIHGIFGVLTIAGCLYQYFLFQEGCFSWSIPSFRQEECKHQKKNDPSTYCRSWKPLRNDVGNYFDFDNFQDLLGSGASLIQFQNVLVIADQIRAVFGFQFDNAKNQTEHVLYLLTNKSRSSNPFESLHRDVFANYTKWCRKLGVEPLSTNAQQKNACKLAQYEELLTVDLCLFFFIWGEASNLRHAPEYLCYLFHKMKYEYPLVKHQAREAGFFLDYVITPVYSILRDNMTCKKDHIERKNYDDFNEFFWSSECLQYGYKAVDSEVEAGVPSQYSFLKPKDRIASVVDAYDTATKTFLEKRTWLTPLRSFYRIYAFHVVTFHLLGALAFCDYQHLSFDSTIRIVSSVLLTPLVLDVGKDLLDMYAIYAPVMSLVPTIHVVCRTLLHLSLVLCGLVLFGFAYEINGIYWHYYWSILSVFLIPSVVNCMLQVMPGTMKYIQNSSLMHLVTTWYVGDDVHDPVSASIQYYWFWCTLLLWKLFFSYRFEIYPLAEPTILLVYDYNENEVTLLTTAILIAMQWAPFVLIYLVDSTIWYALWLSFVGTFVGFGNHVGEIRNFERIRQSFFYAADVFNFKLLAKSSFTGRKLQSTKKEGSYGSFMGSDELLTQNSMVTDETEHQPLLSSASCSSAISFSRHTRTQAEKVEQRRMKWYYFSSAWNDIIHAMRQGDIINNREMSILSFCQIKDCQRKIFVPQFQLAGCFTSFATKCEDYYNRFYSSTISSIGNYDEYELQQDLLKVVTQDAMVEEAIGEVWELTEWLFRQLLGPCHSTDIRHILNIVFNWHKRGAYRAIHLGKIYDATQLLADIVVMLDSNIKNWRAQAKTVPQRKSPSDFPDFHFPDENKSGPPSRSFSNAPSGMLKSASTTGLSKLGASGNVPRRSQGPGVARIAAMQVQEHASRPAAGSGNATHSISLSHIAQVREKIRVFLNFIKNNMIDSMVSASDPIFPDSKAISDRLTWILTQETGFMWDDNYAGEQLTLFCLEKDANAVVSHLRGLIHLQRIDAQPQSYEARRRLLFFVNSLFMDMPSPPSIEEMYSYSAITPFYGEDVLYSRSDLEKKSDGLDVHTLLYLQTLYKRDWENFLERVKPRKLNKLWSDPHVAQELRLWASLRGQTLARTVQGMMYSEKAIRLLSELEGVATSKINNLVKSKFTYILACQIYGRQKRNNDPRARDIDLLLHRFENLRVCYIDEVRVNYQKDHSYFSVLIRGDKEKQDNVREVYRVRLPGNPIVGEGKPENQNAAIIYTRGEYLQTIDMNQDGYLEEALKVRNVLQEFNYHVEGRPYTIVGMPEHVFTGSVSSLANYMALQETSFVTLGQRTMANPLRIRLHYGHPDIFNKIFAISNGGVSKASRGINLSEDVFAGYNTCLRGGSVKFAEYTKFGKGRDVGMQQIYKFEAKLAQGAAEQSLSRDAYRLGLRLDFFKLLSFYYNHIGFYLSTSFIVWNLFVLTYLMLVRTLLGLETIGDRYPIILSRLQDMLGAVAFFTTAPLVATISVERGFKAAVSEMFIMIATGGPLYFLFHIGTKWYYYGQAILVGGAKYRATGRGFVTKHSSFDELFRFYASSHLYAGAELVITLSIICAFTINTQYVVMTWTLWFISISWLISPLWFNPLAFEWNDSVRDVRLWLRWMYGDGGTPEQSWEAWFKDENSHYYTLKLWAKACTGLKAVLYFIVGLSLFGLRDEYHRLTNVNTWLPLLIVFTLLLLSLLFWGILFKLYRKESIFVRFMKLIFVIFMLSSIIVCFVFVDNIFDCIIGLCYITAGIGIVSLLSLGSSSLYVQSLYFLNDLIFGAIYHSVILILAALFVPGKIQTWLLFNNALSRGVVIEDIIRTNRGDEENDDDNMTLNQMKTIILEQQKVISALTNGAGVISGNESSDEKSDTNPDSLHSSSSDAALTLKTHVSEANLTGLKEASRKLSELVANHPVAGPPRSKRSVSEADAITIL